LSYYHLRVSEIRPFGSIAGSGLSREDQGRAPVLLNSFVLQQFGATVGQSLGNHVVLGSTLKLVRGALASDGSDGADASLDRAAELTGKTRTHGDLDLGAMAVFGAVRFGIAVKNVTQPTFQSDTGAITLQRQVRLGVAAMSPAGRTAGPVTIAVDADLTRTPTATGDARHVAAGLDLGLFRRMLSVRGGVAANTVGGARPTGSGGVSLALRSGLFLDAQATAGNDQARRSWGIALRVIY